jgi:sugar lactone lactonase YvrE
MSSAFNTISRLTLIAENLGWPNGLAIDRPAGRLYWNDAKRKTIESSNLSGQDRRVVVKNIPHPYGLVIVGTHMYWTDWQTKALHRADKTNGTDNTIIRGKLDGLMDVRSVQVRLTKTDLKNVTLTQALTAHT